MHLGRDTAPGKRPRAPALEDEGGAHPVRPDIRNLDVC